MSKKKVVRLNESQLRTLVRSMMTESVDGAPDEWQPPPAEVVARLREDMKNKYSNERFQGNIFDTLRKDWADDTWIDMKIDEYLGSLKSHVIPYRGNPNDLDAIHYLIDHEARPPRDFMGVPVEVQRAVKAKYGRG